MVQIFVFLYLFSKQTSTVCYETITAERFLRKVIYGQLWLMSYDFFSFKHAYLPYLFLKLVNLIILCCKLQLVFRPDTINLQIVKNEMQIDIFKQSRFSLTLLII